LSGKFQCLDWARMTAMTENPISAKTPWDEVEPEFQRCFAMAWDSWRAGSFPVGTLITDASGAIVVEGRNRQFEKSAPNGHLFNTWLAHGEVDAIGQLPVAEYTDYTLWTSLEPCLLCLSAIVHAHVGTVRWAGADPLWRGIEKLPELNEQTAFRWPNRMQTDNAALCAFGAVVPLAYGLSSKSGSNVEICHRARWPKLVDLALRLIAEERLTQLQEQEVSDAYNDLHPQLVEASLPNDSTEWLTLGRGHNTPKQ
jgi:tRNA(Arg) A34 adenosine deaminase TadA